MFSNSIFYFQAANDAAKQTGAGKQPKLTEFQEMCLSFVSSAKGPTAVNYIDTNEPSGTDSVRTNDSANKGSIDSDIDFIELVGPDPELTSRTKKRKVSGVHDKSYDKTHSKTHCDSWKEKYFDPTIRDFMKPAFERQN